jgi:hypothetical protein
MVKAVPGTNWAKGIHDLAYTAGRANGAAGSIFQEDWVGLAANIGGGAGKFVWWAREKFDILDKAKLDAPGPTKTPTYIVDLAMNVITYIDFLNGVADPNKGEIFDTGKLQLELADSKLEAAVPDKGKWDGDAAEAYAAQNALMRILAQKMQELDKQMQALLQEQADAVQEAHRCCLYSLMTLVFAQGIALLLWVNATPLASVKFQLATVLPIYAAVAYEELAALLKSSNVADEVDKLAAAYNDVTQSAPGKMSIPENEVPEAAESYISSFEAVSASMSGMSSSSDMSTLASLVSTAGERVSADKRALLSALAGDGETPGDRTPVKTPEGTPETPVSTPPILAGLAAMSRQAAKPSGSAYPQTKAAARTAEAAAEEAAPAEATVVGDVEGAGAAVGVAAAERAPIDVAAVGPQQAQQPSPVQRIA